jgi:F0F1-type ATP synthase assembly protein I
VDPSSSRGIGKYTSLALLLPISTIVGYLMGYGLDHLFHTSWLRWVFLALGTIAGFIELLRELDKDA